MRTRTGWIAGGAGLSLMIATIGCGDDDDSGNSGRDGGADAAMQTGTGGSNSGGITLPDGTTGKPCTSNDDCSGGTCAMQLGGGLGGQAMMAPGGYCTLMCSDSSQCGSGAACIGGLGGMAGVPATGQCMSQCLNADDCRDGYVCGGGFSVGGISVPNTCAPRPHTDQLDDGVAGDMCSSDDDCKGGRCLTMRPGFLGNGGTMLPGGYCSGDCLEDAECGDGGVCLLPAFGMGAGSCYQSCMSDGDCTRDGYRCRMLGNEMRGCNPAANPLPDGTTGKACTADADCGGAMGSCAKDLPGEGFTGFFQRWPAEGGYCTQSCMEDSDCGAGGVCLGATFAAGTCFAKCTAMTDCRDGYTCSDRGAMRGMMGAGMGNTDGGMAMPAPTVCSPNPPPMMMPDEDGGASMPSMPSM